MAQNIYDNLDFFQAYAQLNRCVYGLDGAPEWRTIVTMLPKMEDLSVIDLGCGYGWFCRYSRQEGAKSVTGLDISQRMLKKAREMTTENSILYRQEDLELVKLPYDTYDLAYSSLTLHYIENLSALINTVYRSLRSGGYFIFSVEHPIYTAPKHPDWLIDRGEQKSWPVNNYQAEGLRVTNWLVEGVIKQHRTIGTYLNMLINQGFLVRQLIEWGPTSQQILENPILDEEKERPMILLVSVQKPNN